jgi:outer membrane protein assembly factor BamB
MNHSLPLGWRKARRTKPAYLISLCSVALTFLPACASDTTSSPAPAGKTSTDDWTMLGYDLGSTYWNKGETKITKKTATKLDKAWDFDGQGSVTSTPVISGGKVYVVSQGVIAIDLVSGKQLWTNPDLTGSSSLALSDGVLYVNDSTATLRALRVKDGTEIWNYKPTDLPDGA